MQSGAVWLWRERRGAALGRCRNGGAQPRAAARRAQPPQSADPPPAGGGAPSPGRGGGPPPPRVRRTRAADDVRCPAAGGGLRPEPAPCWGLAGDGVQIGGESRAAGPAAEPPPRTKSAEAARRAAGPAARNLPTAGACRGIKEK